MSGRSRGKGSAKGGLTVQELKAMTAARIAQTQTIEHQHYPHSHHPQYRQQPDIRGYASTANGVIQQHSLGSYQHQHHVNMGNNMDGSRNNHMSSNHVYGNSSLSHQMAGVGQFADSGPYATAMEMRRQAQNSPAFAGNPGGSTMRFNNHDSPLLANDFYSQSSAAADMNSAQSRRVDRWSVDPVIAAGNGRIGAQQQQQQHMAPQFFHPLSQTIGFVAHSKPHNDRGSSSGETTLGDSDMHSLSSFPAHSLSGTNTPDSDETFIDSFYDAHHGTNHSLEYGLNGGSMYSQPQVRGKGNSGLGFRQTNHPNQGMASLAMADPGNGQQRFGAGAGAGGGFRPPQAPARHVTQQSMMGRFEPPQTSGVFGSSLDGHSQGYHGKLGDQALLDGSDPYFATPADLSVFGAHRDSGAPRQFHGATTAPYPYEIPHTDYVSKMMGSYNPFETTTTMSESLLRSAAVPPDSLSMSLGSLSLEVLGASSQLDRGNPLVHIPTIAAAENSGSDGASMSYTASPKSLRHKQQLPIACPSPLRVRSLSDCNSLAFEMAESVLDMVSMGSSNPGSGSNTPRPSHKMLVVDGRRRTGSADSDSVSPRNSLSGPGSMGLRRMNSKDSMSSALSESEALSLTDSKGTPPLLGALM